MKKGILIDVHNRTITEVEITKDKNDSELQSMYDHIKCEMVECVSFNEKNDVWVNEEGLLNLTPFSMFFKIEGYPDFLCGNGLILGYDDETGDSSDTTLTIDDVKSKVTFHTLNEVEDKWFS
jgi:hypothetical protein